MADKTDRPFVSASQEMAELTVKAVILGVVMAVGLGAANAYLGMKAGLTVAATFPAAVVAMAALRGLGGTVLEENLARTTASVGEALVAGAIFTIPAFVISGAWDTLHYWESTAIMMIGGILGVLFVIVLRRTLVVEADLPLREAELEGIAWLPRILVKARAKLRGELHPDIMYCCGGDFAFLRGQDVAPADFLRVIWASGGDDAKVLAYLRRHEE